MGAEKLIYGLRDPRTQEIRYVGQSTVGLQRPRQHGYRGHGLRQKGRKTNWILQLRREQLDFEIVVLQRLTDSATQQDVDEAEIEWIRVGRLALGNRLLNRAEGGQNTDESDRLRLATTMKSPYTRGKLSAVMGSPQMRQRQRDAKLDAMTLEQLLASVLRAFTQRARSFVWTESQPYKQGTPNVERLCVRCKKAKRSYRTSRYCRPCMYERQAQPRITENY